MITLILGKMCSVDIGQYNSLPPPLCVTYNCIGCVNSDLSCTGTNTTNFTFCGPCIVIYLRDKDQQDALFFLNPLTPNDLYMSRTAPLTSKRCILYIYSTNIGTEYFKHALYSPFSSLQNAVCFIMLTSLFPVLFTFYRQSVLKLKKNNNSGAKGLIYLNNLSSTYFE